MRFVSVPLIPGPNREASLGLGRKASSEMARVFNLIREKGVGRIMELQVDDDVDRPCRDEVIKASVKGFKVDFLDWKKTDVCLDVLLDVARDATGLRLYSSGNLAVLKSWSSHNGLPLFTKVCSQRIFLSHHSFLKRTLANR